MPITPTSFSDWSTFAEILGSAAGALTGLQFVTMALIADIPLPSDQTDPSEAFATPTVVHFSTALFLAAIFSAPWQTIFAPALLWGAAGIFGVLYTLVIISKMRSQIAYDPVFEDWCFHAFLPLVAYAILAASAFATRSHTRPAFFAVAGAALLLLFIGIHNAWDNATFLVQRKRAQKL